MHNPSLYQQMRVTKMPAEGAKHPRTYKQSCCAVPGQSLDLSICCDQAPNTESNLIGPLSVERFSAVWHRFTLTLAARVTVTPSYRRVARVMAPSAPHWHIKELGKEQRLGVLGTPDIQGAASSGEEGGRTT